MEASSSKTGVQTTVKVKEKPGTEDKPRRTIRKHLPSFECKKQMDIRWVNERWLAAHDTYFEKKAFEEMKNKRKREEEKALCRWTRANETNKIEENYKKMKEEQKARECSRNNDDKRDKTVIDLEENTVRKTKNLDKAKKTMVDDLKERTETEMKIEIKWNEAKEKDTEAKKKMDDDLEPKADTEMKIEIKEKEAKEKDTEAKKKMDNDLEAKADTEMKIEIKRKEAEVKKTMVDVLEEKAEKRKIEIVKDTQRKTKFTDKGKKPMVDDDEEDAQPKKKIKMNRKEEKSEDQRIESLLEIETKTKIEDKGKKTVVDDEGVQIKKKMKVKGKETKANVERVIKQKSGYVLKGRATVRQLFETMRGLSSERKKVIRDMGFGDLIDFPIFEIPSKLAFYIVDILNTTKMTLECPNGDIVITPKTVNQVLGLPLGRRKLIRNGQREYNDPFLVRWKEQFKNVNKLTVKALADTIIETKNSDYMFRMNILTLIANTLGSCENSTTANLTVLKNVFEGDDVSDIDWCSYIVECASDSKNDWATKLKKKEVVYYGPAMFLMLAYLHYMKFDKMKVKRRVPGFKSWNTSLLKKREVAELQNEYMGFGEILDDIGEGEEPDEKQELYEMLEENIRSILIEKSETEEMINESLMKYKDDEKLLELKQQMKDIFKEPRMPAYQYSSSSESDDDEYESEDEENNKNNVPMVEAWKKDGSKKTKYDAECSEKKDEKEMANTNNIDYKAECSEKKDETKSATFRKEEDDMNNEEGIINEKATNQEKPVLDENKKGIANDSEEIAEKKEDQKVNSQSSDEKKNGLADDSEKSAEKKQDKKVDSQSNDEKKKDLADDSEKSDQKKEDEDDYIYNHFFDNEEELIKQTKEYNALSAKKEKERKRKEKIEKYQREAYSEESPVFGIEHSLTGSQPSFDLGTSPLTEMMMTQRQKKKERGLRSIYVNKRLEASTPLTKDEKLVGRYMLSLIADDNEEQVFSDGDDWFLYKQSLKTLLPRQEIDVNVIDAYVYILNYEEKFKKKKMKRHFFYSTMMVPGILKDKKSEFKDKVKEQYEKFQTMICNQMENDVKKLQMQDIDLAFFPIIAYGHYYIIVFFIKTGNAVILDNSISNGTYDGKYRDNVNFVRQVFGNHLCAYQNRFGDKVLSHTKKATILNMPWKTTNEKKDCGVYLIMHMELYEGSTEDKWKTGLLPENDNNHRQQMDELRTRIASKILLHELNDHRMKMSEYATHTQADEGGSDQQ